MRRCSRFFVTLRRSLRSGADMGWRGRVCIGGCACMRVVVLAGVVGQPSKPDGCPHQMSPRVEALIVELRGAHPGWGPRTLLFQLEARGVRPLPGRSSVYRCLLRHGLIEPLARRRRKADYKRWERSRAME